MLEAKTDNSSNESLVANEKLKPSKRNNPAFDRKRSRAIQSHTDSWWLGLLKGDSQSNELMDSFTMPLTTIYIMMAHASVASSKPKWELDLHTITWAIGDNCFVIHDHNQTLNVYSYNPKDGHRSAKIVDAILGYQDPRSGWRYIWMIKQAICIDGLKNHLLYQMQGMACISVKSQSS